jgi:signal peptidase I
MITKKLKFLIIISICSIAIAIAIVLFLVEANNRFYVVVSESMTPNLNTGDIVIVKHGKENGPYFSSSSFNNLEIGDIIVFKRLDKSDAEPHNAVIPRHDIIVHRVVQVMNDSSGDRILRTKGDANLYSIKLVDFPVKEEDYIGKVIYTIPSLGLILVYVDIIIKVASPPILFILVGTVITVIVALMLKERLELARK